MSKRSTGHKTRKLTSEDKKKRAEKNERRDRAGTIAKKQRQKIVPDDPAA